VRKPAALRGGLCAGAARTHPTAWPTMAVPGTFLTSVLLLLCGLGPYLDAAQSPPGKGAHGPRGGPEATAAHGWWGCGVSLPGDGGRGRQDLRLRGPVGHGGVRQRPRDPRGTPGPLAPTWPLAVGLPGEPGCAREPRWVSLFRPGAGASLAAPAPWLPVPRFSWPRRSQPHRHRCWQGPWPWGCRGAGRGGGQRQDVMRRSHRPGASARQGGSQQICPFHHGHVSRAGRGWGMGNSGSSLHPAPSPQPSFSKKKIHFLAGCQ